MKKKKIIHNVKEQNQGSSNSDWEGKAIDRYMTSIPYVPNEFGNVRLVQNMLFNNVTHSREVMTDYMI